MGLSPSKDGDLFGINGPVGAAGIAALTYFSPLSQNGVIYVAGQAAAATYGIHMFVNQDLDQMATIKNAAMVGAAAAAGYMGAPYVSLDPVLAAAIVAPAAFIMLK